jgi:hypothetical protein
MLLYHYAECHYAECRGTKERVFSYTKGWEIGQALQAFGETAS